MKKVFNKGFTLIELLIVIAILGIIIAAVVAGIDPVDKINLSNDAKVQSDIGAMGTAFEAYSALNNGTYATSIAALVTSGDLKTALTAPSGYVPGYTVACTVAPCGTQAVYAQVKANKWGTSTWWKWCSSTGRVGTVTNTSACP